MGIDYDATAGYGIYLDDEHFEKLGWADELEENSDKYSFLDDLARKTKQVSFATFGLFDEENEYCFLVRDSDFLSIEKNVSTFIEEVNKLGLSITDKDIEFICEPRVS